MTRNLIIGAVLLATGCGTINIDPQQADEQEARDALATSGLAAQSSECHPVGGLVKTFGVAHIGNESLQQQAGPLLYLNLDRKNPVPGTTFTRGTILATITGVRTDGSLAVNHHFLMNAGTLRTLDDVVALTPTDDPCLFDLSAELFIADGTGAFDGASGSGQAEGKVDFCSGVGRLAWIADVCVE